MWRISLARILKLQRRLILYKTNACVGRNMCHDNMESRQFIFFKIQQLFNFPLRPSLYRSFATHVVKWSSFFGISRMRCFFLSCEWCEHLRIFMLGCCQLWLTFFFLSLDVSDIFFKSNIYRDEMHLGNLFLAAAWVERGLPRCLIIIGAVSPVLFLFKKKRKRKRIILW